jgi:hypothetical protein
MKVVTMYPVPSNQGSASASYQTAIMNDNKTLLQALEEEVRNIQASKPLN